VFKFKFSNFVNHNSRSDHFRLPKSVQFHFSLLNMFGRNVNVHGNFETFQWFPKIQLRNGL